MPLFSVIVPVYNAEQTIEKCINSILVQSVEDFELILIDDGSADSSLLICQNYASRDSRIILFSQSNKGVSSARNKGIELSSGDYLVFVDSDDYIDLDYLSAFMTNESADMVIGGFILEDMEGNSKKTVSYLDEIILIDNKYSAIKRLFVEGRFNMVWGKAFKRSVLSKSALTFYEKIDLGEDTLFVIEFLKNVTSIKFIAESMYHHLNDRVNSLSVRNNDIDFINKLERVNSMIYSDLSSMIGENDSIKNISLRLGSLYKSLLNVYLEQYSSKKKIVKHLYSQTWFRHSLDYVDELYADESEKYRAILRTKNFIIMNLYVKYKMFLRK